MESSERTRGAATDFDEEARAALRAEFDPDKELQELARDAEATTPQGRPAKRAKEAQAALEMTQAVEPTLHALNALVGARWPELRHTDAELRVYAVLGGKVLAKHIDTTMTKYGDEILLATTIAGNLGTKGWALFKRVQAEREAELAGAELTGGVDGSG